MAEVSYEHYGSHRKQSSSSYRSYTSSREMETTNAYSDSQYKSTNYRDFDDIASKDSQPKSTSRRESDSRENRGYRGIERDQYPPYRINRQSFTEENVKLIQPGRGKSKTASSFGDTDSVRTDSSRIPMGLEILQNVDGFVIRQNPESEAWWETARFQVEDGRGKRLFEIKQEKADNKCAQAVFGKMREYFMKVYVGNQWIMELEHPWSFLSPIFCPWASPSLVVRMPTGEVLGEVRNASRETCATCLPPTKYFEVVNFDGSIIHAVTGPTCYPFECSSDNPASFELLKVENNAEKALPIGQITHVWRGCCGGISSCCVTGELEMVSVTFPKECQTEEKALFLALGFLVLFTFFDFL